MEESNLYTITMAAGFKIMLVLMVLCVALAVALPSRRRGHKARIEALERRVYALVKHTSDLQIKRTKNMPIYKKKMQDIENRIAALENAKWTLTRVKFSLPGLQKKQLLESSITQGRLSRVQTSLKPSSGHNFSLLKPSSNC